MMNQKSVDLLAEKLWALAAEMTEKMIEKISNIPLEDVPLEKTAAVLCTVIDKALLLDGKRKQEYVGLTDQERTDRILELFERAQARQAATTAVEETAVDHDSSAEACGANDAPPTPYDQSLAPGNSLGTYAASPRSYSTTMTHTLAQPPIRPCPSVPVRVRPCQSMQTEKYVQQNSATFVQKPRKSRQNATGASKAGPIKQTTIAQLRISLPAVVEQITQHNERILLTRHGHPVAALVPVPDLRLLERLSRQLDVLLVSAALEELT